MIQNIFSEEIIQAIGWTMIHSLWQGFAVAVLMGIVMIGLQKRSSKVRHEFAFFSLFLIFIISLSTFIYLYDSVAEGAALGTTITVITEGGFVLENATIVQSFFQKSIEYFNEHLPLIVTLWLTGMVFFLLRLLGGLAFIQKLKTQQQQALPAEWQAVFEKIQAKFPMKKTVRIVESALAKTPMVIGYLKPVILFPLGAVNQLTQQEVEAVLAHELAHIYRNDYLLNIIQSFIETIFYYHPAVWWISANIRMERENCCDDIAVKICGSSITYVKALVTLEEIQPAPNLAMSFSSGSKNQLLNRVKRILNQPQNKFNIMEKFTATCFLLVALFLFSFSPTKSEENQTNENSTKIEAAPLGLISAPETDTIPAPPPPPHEDKLRKKGNSNFVYVKDGESVEVKYKNDEIVKLKINGEEIEEEDFTNYEGYIDELVDEIPLPPPPPHVPHNSVSKITSNGTTTTFSGEGTRIVTKSEDENGNTVYIIKSDDEEAPMVIKGGRVEVDGEIFRVGSAPAVISDGKTISISDGAVIIDGRAMSISADDFNFDFNENDFDFVIADVAELVEQAELPDFPEFSSMAVFPDMPDLPELSFADLDNFHFNFDTIPSGSIMINGERKKWSELSEEEKRDFEEEMQTLKAEMKEQRESLHREMKEMQETRREEYKVQMEEARERMEEARVQMREVQQEQRERVREIQQQQRELQQDMREQQREMREQQRELRGAISAERSKWTKSFEAQLQKDGHIKSDGSFKFFMKDNQLKINGEKQSQADLEKYRSLYEKETGKSLGNDFKIEISTDGKDNRRTSVSISDNSN
ncbi:MAG: M56 family metallopeptidase [Saprospiraceae bacterium]